MLFSESINFSLDPDRLEELAFDAHVEAYEECGIYELPIDDKIDILLTVDLDDLMKENGIEQVGEIIEGQIGYYIDHPNALLEDTWYIIDHWDDIWDTLSEYIDKQKQNKTKAGPIYDEYDVYNLILAPLIEYYEANVPGFEAPELP